MRRRPLLHDCADERRQPEDQGMMALYPQPKRASASVEFVPAPYRRPAPR